MLCEVEAVIISSLEGPFTQYVETGWITVHNSKATVAVLCDEGVKVFVFTKESGVEREYIFNGGDTQQLIKGRWVKIVVEGEGVGYVRLMK